MGNASCRGCLLSVDPCWEGALAALTASLHPKLTADATAVVLALLDAVDLKALACCCAAFAATARAVCATLDETFWMRACERRGWSWDSLSEVGVHVTSLAPGTRRAQALLPAIPPSWLRRLLDGSPRLARPRYHHMTAGVVGKVLDSCGSLDAPRSSFARRPRWQSLFEAHCKHGKQAGEALVAAEDVAQLRKLRGLMAYMFAEGWGQLPGTGSHDASAEAGELYDHVWEHALAGRIEV